MRTPGVKTAPSDAQLLRREFRRGPPALVQYVLGPLQRFMLKAKFGDDLLAGVFGVSHPELADADPGAGPTIDWPFRLFMQPTASCSGFTALLQHHSRLFEADDVHQPRF